VLRVPDFAGMTDDCGFQDNETNYGFSVAHRLKNLVGLNGCLVMVAGNGAGKGFWVEGNGLESGGETWVWVEGQCGGGAVGDWTFARMWKCDGVAVWTFQEGPAGDARAA
jgi:hypothetical protein